MNPEKSDTSTNENSIPPKFWWRLELRRYAYCDGDGDTYGFTEPEVECRPYRVVKRTPKGVRLETGRLVLLDAKKQWASPTIKEATKHFVERRKAEIRILENRLRVAKTGYNDAVAGKIKVFQPYACVL